MSRYHSITNEIEICVTAEKLFNYVTQPWLWHEWHPSSQSARAAHSFLAAGDEFDEVIMVRPLAPLPLRLTRDTRYRVTEAFPFHSWEVQGTMKDGKLTIRYDFEESAEHIGITRFQRTLSFEIKGPMRLLGPFLKWNMRAVSRQAMNQLKIRMEKLEGSG
jgi:hypothetical protein